MLTPPCGGHLARERNRMGVPESKPKSIDPEAVAQARAAWEMAVELLMASGMREEVARRAFGKLLSKHNLNARALFPALEACRAAGTPDAMSFIVKAAQRASERAGDPALKCDWG